MHFSNHLIDAACPHFSQHHRSELFDLESTAHPAVSLRFRKTI